MSIRWQRQLLLSKCYHKNPGSDGCGNQIAGLMEGASTSRVNLTNNNDYGLVSELLTASAFPLPKVECLACDRDALARRWYFKTGPESHPGSAENCSESSCRHGRKSEMLARSWEADSEQAAACCLRHLDEFLKHIESPAV